MPRTSLAHRHPGEEQASFHGGKVPATTVFFGPPLATIIYPQLREFILEHNKAPKVVKEAEVLNAAKRI